MTGRYTFQINDEEAKNPVFLDCWKNCGYKGWLHRLTGKSFFSDERGKKGKSIAQGGLRHIQTDNKNDYECWLNCAIRAADEGSPRWAELWRMKNKLREEEFREKKSSLNRKIAHTNVAAGAVSSALAKSPQLTTEEQAEVEREFDALRLEDEEAPTADELAELDALEAQLSEEQEGGRKRRRKRRRKKTKRKKRRRKTKKKRRRKHRKTKEKRRRKRKSRKTSKKK